MPLQSPSEPMVGPTPLDVANTCYRACDEVRIGNLRLFVFHDLATAEPVWREIERCENVSVFQSYDWAQAWARTNGRVHGETYRAYVGYYGNHPVALAAFAVERRGRTRIATPIGGIHAARGGTIHAHALLGARKRGAMLAEIGQAIRSDLSVDAVLMPYLNAESADDEAAVGGLSIVGPSPDPVFISHIEPWDIFEPKHRTSKQRGNDRRNSKPLERLGEVAFEMVDDAAERDVLLERMFDWKSRQFAESGIFDRFAESGARSFYKALAATASQNQPLLGVLRVAGDPAAIVFGIGSGDTIYGLVTAISPDPAFRRGSPGALCFERFVKSACDAGRYERIDFGVGGNAIKDRWCDATERLKFRYEAHTLRGLVICVTEVCRESIKRFLRSHPKLTALYYKYRRDRALQKIASDKTGHPIRR